jgi:uncharacterized protein
MTGTRPSKADALHELFGRRNVIIGTIHLHALPGAPAYGGETVDEILGDALQDARAYEAGGVDGIIVENSGDLPFSKPGDIGPDTVAFMTRITAAVVAESGVPVGVNCLANAVVPAIAIAAASGARFVRANQWVNAYIANEGFIEGPAAAALRFRRSIYAQVVKIFADVHVKHGGHAIVADRTVAEQARDAEFFDADVLIATGTRTGQPTSVDEVLAIRDGSELPVIVGSGLASDNLDALFAAADGAIVGSSLKVNGVWWERVDQQRVASMVRQARSARGDAPISS